MHVTYLLDYFLISIIKDRIYLQVLRQDPISLHRMTAGISYKLSYRQQTKVQKLTLLSSKGFIYFRNLSRNLNVRKMSQQQQQAQ